MINKLYDGPVQMPRQQPSATTPRHSPSHRSHEAQRRKAAEAHVSISSLLQVLCCTARGTNVCLFVYEVCFVLCVFFWFVCTSDPFLFSMQYCVILLKLIINKLPRSLPDHNTVLDIMGYICSFPSVSHPTCLSKLPISPTLIPQTQTSNLFMTTVISNPWSLVCN